jgi:hypothetical protein
MEESQQRVRNFGFGCLTLIMLQICFCAIAPAPSTWNDPKPHHKICDNLVAGNLLFTQEQCHLSRSTQDSITHMFFIRPADLQFVLTGMSDFELERDHQFGQCRTLSYLLLNRLILDDFVTFQICQDELVRIEFSGD